MSFSLSGMGIKEGGERVRYGKENGLLPLVPCSRTNAGSEKFVVPIFRMTSVRTSVRLFGHRLCFSPKDGRDAR